MTASYGLSRRSDDVLCTAVTAPVLAPGSVPPEELLGGVAGVGAQARGDHPPVLGLEPRHLRQALVEIVLALRYQGLSEPQQPVLDAGVDGPRSPWTWSVQAMGGRSHPLASSSRSSPR